MVRGLVTRGLSGRFGWLVYFLPLIFGIVSKCLHSRAWLGDYEAVACAGEKIAAGQAIYSMGLHCDGMHASVYVYLPWVAQVAAVGEHGLGHGGFFLVYMCLFVMSCLALVIVPLSSGLSPQMMRQKICFAVFLSASAFIWGNVAVLLHAAILVAGLWLDVTPWGFVIAVAVAAGVKPIFLAYLVVLLLMRRPLVQRLIYMTICGVAGLAPTVAFWVLSPQAARQWMPILSHFVYTDMPGYGFYGWLQLLGLPGNSIGADLGYLAYAAAMTSAALVLGAALRLSSRERLWLGFSFATLLIPRVMSQDLFLLGPGLAVVAARLGPLLKDSRMTVFRFDNDRLAGLAGIFPQAVCLVVLAGGCIGIGILADEIALFCICLYLIFAAVCLRAQVSGISRPTIAGPSAVPSGAGLLSADE